MGAAGQVGFGVAILIIAALFVGRWLDNLLGTGPILLLTCTLVSIPVSLILMVQTVLTAARVSQSPNGNQDFSQREEDNT